MHSLWALYTFYMLFLSGVLSLRLCRFSDFIWLAVRLQRGGRQGSVETVVAHREHAEDSADGAAVFKQ